MESYCFPSSRLPGSSRLFSHYLSDFELVSPFYPHPPAIERVVRTAGASIPPKTRSIVIDVLQRQNESIRSDASVRHNLARLRDGAVAIVTGQQAGLLTGPAYTIHKAVTAIAVARRLTELGVDAVPIFWIASDDHDLAEANHSDWLAEATIESLRCEIPGEAEGRSVGAVRLGAEATRLARRASQLLEGPDSRALAEAIAQSVGPDETFASSFAKLMAAIFNGRGLILLDPRAPELRRLAAPLVRQAITKCSSLLSELQSRGRALEKAGLHTQVKVTVSSTVLFLEVEGKRLAVRRRGETFAAGSQTITEAELLARLDARPEDFSANALFRPVVQDALLPTAAFIAGPAEIAYLAQSEVLYRALGVRMPVVLPRAGFTLVEPGVARLLKKYGLKAEEILEGSAAVRRRLERASLASGLRAQFAKGEKELRSLLKRLGPAVAKVDGTLKGAAATAERKMLYQFLKLRDKTARAHALRNEVLARHEQSLVNSLAPRKGPQERTLSALPSLARHGLELLTRLELYAGEVGQHHVLFL